jgi:hypothetical protein
VAELVDAADSKSAAFTGVLVRFQSWARANFKTLISFDKGSSFRGTFKGHLGYRTSINTPIIKAGRILTIDNRERQAMTCLTFFLNQTTPAGKIAK